MNKDHQGSRNYYQNIVPGYEYMDIMEHVLGYDGVVSHLKGQVFKYMFRMGKKDSGESEAVKVAWYSSRLLDVSSAKPQVHSPSQSKMIQYERT